MHTPRGKGPGTDLFWLDQLIDHADTHRADLAKHVYRMSTRGGWPIHQIASAAGVSKEIILELIAEHRAAPQPGLVARIRAFMGW